MTHDSSLSALKQAVSIVGLSTLAKAAGVKSPTVFRWYQTGRAPAERVLAIEAATDGRVTRYQLRPDVYGQPPTATPCRRTTDLPAPEDRAA